MELTVERIALHNALKITCTAAGKANGPDIPRVVLRAFMGTLEGLGSLECYGTDLTVSARCTCQATVKKDGAIAVDAKDVLQIVKNLPRGVVTIKDAGKTRIMIKAGSSTFRVHRYNADDVPVVEVPDDDAYSTVPAGLFVDLLTRGGSAHSDDSTRSNLQNIHVEGDGEVLRMVTTDGHRMHMAETESSWSPGKTKGIPPRGRRLICETFADLQGDCEIAVADDVWFVRRDAVTISAKPLRGAFPPWRKVVPATAASAITVERAHLIAVVNRVALMAESRTRTVVLELLPGKLRLSSKRDDYGEAQEAIEVEHDASADTEHEVKTAVNANYFLAALEQVQTDGVRLEFNEQLDPVVVRPMDLSDGVVGEDFLAVVMPLRL